MNPIYKVIAVAALTLYSAIGFCTDTALKVHSPWIQHFPPVIEANSGYMTLENTSNQAIVIVGAKSSAFGRVMIHKTEIQDGMAKMSHQGQLVILPHNWVDFKPGGFHVMLMKRKHELQLGDKVDLTLVMQDGSEVAVIAEVRNAEEADQAQASQPSDTADLKSNQLALAKKEPTGDITFIFLMVGVVINLVLLSVFLLWAFKNWNKKEQMIKSKRSES